VFEKCFSLFYIISTQRSHIYKKLDTNSCFAKLRAISNLFSFFLYTLYVPPGTLLSEKMIEDAHVQMLHGGVGLTMALIRQRYWIPRLRQSTKKVIASCHGCKRFHVTAYHNPPVGNLPQKFQAIYCTKGTSAESLLGQW
jgi:hypothetical protein